MAVRFSNLLYIKGKIKSRCYSVVPYPPILKWRREKLRESFRPFAVLSVKFDAKRKWKIRQDENVRNKEPVSEAITPSSRNINGLLLVQ